MLAAHLVPGYFNAVLSKSSWDEEWSDGQRVTLWAVAFAGTVLPDTDVIFNILFRRVFNHSTLLTHSIIPVVILFLIWAGLKFRKKSQYARTVFLLLGAGWFSHLVLDMLVHSTPLFYPISEAMIGYAPQRVYEGGFFYYLTDPIFLLEPLMFTFAATHWIAKHIDTRRTRLIGYVGVSTMFALFSIIFLLALPMLQRHLPPA